MRRAVASALSKWTSERTRKVRAKKNRALEVNMAERCRRRGNIGHRGDNELLLNGY